MNKPDRFDEYALVTQQNEREPTAGRTYARIVGTGSCLPARSVSNEQLAAELAQRGVETSDEWIATRTGIRHRYLAAPDQTTSDLAYGAAQQALTAAGLAANQIDLIIVATSTPDAIFPSTACLLQQKLGVSGAAAFDVQAVCSGFVYALSIANSMLVSGQHQRALVVGAEVFSRILDWNDRTTCVLFGDGAGAVILEAGQTPGVLACALHADGNQKNILCANGQISHGEIVGHPYLKMDGQAVFKLAVNVLDQVARECLAQVGHQSEQIDWLIPHQANIRILQSTAKRLGVPEERVIVTVDQHGNTSAASVPLALDQAVRTGKLQRGQRLMLQGVGGGFTWGAVYLIY